MSGEALAGSAVEILKAENVEGWPSAALYATTQALRSLTFTWWTATKGTTKLRLSWTVQGLTAALMSTVSKRVVWGATETFSITEWKATRWQIIL